MKWTALRLVPTTDLLVIPDQELLPSGEAGPPPLRRLRTAGAAAAGWPSFPPAARTLPAVASSTARSRHVLPPRGAARPARRPAQRDRRAPPDRLDLDPGRGRAGQPGALLLLQRRRLPAAAGHVLGLRPARARRAQGQRRQHRGDRRVRGQPGDLGLARGHERQLDRGPARRRRVRARRADQGALGRRPAAAGGREPGPARVRALARRRAGGPVARAAEPDGGRARGGGAPRRRRPARARGRRRAARSDRAARLRPVRPRPGGLPHDPAALAGGRRLSAITATEPGRARRSVTSSACPTWRPGHDMSEDASPAVELLLQALAAGELWPRCAECLNYPQVKQLSPRRDTASRPLARHRITPTRRVLFPASLSRSSALRHRATSASARAVIRSILRVPAERTGDVGQIGETGDTAGPLRSRRGWGDLRTPRPSCCALGHTV